MSKQYLVVAQKADGTVASYRMKDWLRHNPEFIPKGLDPTADTRKLRRGLTQQGWILHEKIDKVILIKPSEERVAIAEGVFDTIPIRAEIETNSIETREIAFGLESDLQRALRADISQLERGLTIVDGGREKTTEAGRFDITAKDKKGMTVIIELKAGMANPDVIAQIRAS